MQAIILAAGRSARMGRQKLLMPCGGGTMIDHVTSIVWGCGFEKVLVVVSRETGGRINKIQGVGYLENPEPDRGLGSSLRVALAAVEENACFTVFLADKPTLTVAQIQALRSCFEASPQSALIPRRGDALGHPGFYAALWRARFLNSDGDGRSTVLRYEKEIEWVPGWESCFFDVDTPEDYQKLRESDQEKPKASAEPGLGAPL